ncbi:MAG: 4Fe-4S binding protein [Candidatus Bathyarchaeota archaeon]|jgi:NADH-quinone oxidoreductase subunit I|nr:4Fe-4S binding protein [Candidatus Bathyarchaeota archaeon]
MPEMVKEVLKNLFSKPATVNYPFEKPEPLPTTRGTLTWDMNRCDECQDCERVCPPMAIKVFPEEKKVEYSPFKCIYCLLCIDNCMQQAITHATIMAAPDYKKRVELFEKKQ